MSYEKSEFYCLNCGNKGIPCLRPQGRRRGVFHRKKLYCPTCKATLNHIECKNEYEVHEFKQMFAEGTFQEEAAISLKECAENA
jgi:hypothetical protein